MSNEMTSKDLYIRISDPSGKNKDVINHHRVWNAERFIAAQQDQHTGPTVKAADRRIVSLATKEEYSPRSAA